MTDFKHCSFIFDVWSLGSILLECLSGFPLWLSLKSRVITLEGRSIINTGLFGVAGRDNGKILNKQNQLLSNGFPGLLIQLKKGFDIGGNIWTKDKVFLNLLSELLCPDPGRRISPDEILNHEFLAWEPSDVDIENITPPNEYGAQPDMQE